MPEIHRDIIIGRNAKVWQVMERHLRKAAHSREIIAISHSDIAKFAFNKNDRIWVFAYSRKTEENEELLNCLANSATAEVIYISSASTIVNRQTRCYEYPRVKQQAEESAVRLLNARILSLGLVFDNTDELPAGKNAATSYTELVTFFLKPHWPDHNNAHINLFTIVEKPFQSTLEKWLYRIYGLMMRISYKWPCMLRPFDFALRALNIRWYGYVYLSNKLWCMTIS